jgi:hypothetical protein
MRFDIGSLSLCAELTRLSLAIGDDKDLESLPSLPKLREVTLDITGKGIGPGLRHLARLPQLEELAIEGTSQVDDSILSHLSELRQLKALELWKTDVSEQGRAWLVANLPNLERIDRKDVIRKSESAQEVAR